MTTEDPGQGTQHDQAAASRLTSAQAANKPPKTRTANRAGTGRPALLIAVLAILMVVVGLFWGYRYQAALAQEITALNAQVGNAFEQQQRLQQALQEATDTLRIQASRDIN